MNKEEKLINHLKKLNRVAICYSGGIDSAYLLTLANNVLDRKNVLALIAKGIMTAKNDYLEAINYLKNNNYDYKEIEYNPLELENFRENKIDRCYYCKKTLLSLLINKAHELNFYNILDGSNFDDLNKYRPGLKALKELNIISPLAICELTKKEIRENSKKLEIPFYNKPSNSCLATRFPYNTKLNKELLNKVDEVEELIKKYDINKVRARIHNDLLRIEVDKKDFNLIINNNELLDKLKQYFNYITIDLEGYSSGKFDKT